MLNGPQFLLCTKELWPSQDIISYNSINLIQEEKRVTENVIKLNEIICFSKFSSCDKLVRVLAYVKRFIFNCSREGKNNKIFDENVTSIELIDTEIFLLSYEQQHFRSKEEFNHLFNSLNVFIDKDGLFKIKRASAKCSIKPTNIIKQK